ELEIEDLANRGMHAVQASLIAAILVVDDLLELAPDEVHGAEHVVLRQRDAHVDAADAAADLEVFVVPRTAEQPIHPRDQADLELAHARLASDEGGARAFVAEDARIEDFGDAGEVGRRVRMERAQGFFVVRVPVDVSFELVEDRFHRRHATARAGRSTRAATASSGALASASL